MTNKVLINFRRYTDGDFESKSRTIVELMTGNSNFPTPVPAITVIADAADDYSSSLITASTGNRADIAAKNQKRADLEELLRILASYINFTADGDRSKLLTTGYDVSKEKAPVTITKPENITVTNGMNPGDLVVSVNAVKGARSYVHEYADEADFAAGKWQSVTASQSKYVFTGLEAGKKYYCRVAAVGSRDQVVYSDPMSRIVL
ncbi:MAG TPA: fibronectin type III domain-containing protein [Chitinophagaceae bacterium]|nr:fibronectin type III domain-containing protein [Chitinophagaceae bacterium]